MRLDAGTMVGPKVRLVRLLGEGGMGSVWEAYHLTLDTRVAVKFITAEAVAQGGEQILRRFEREARAAARVKSPHVVHTYDFGLLGGRIPYIVMELLAGESLGEHLQNCSTVSLPDGVLIVSHTAKALAEAHARGVIHRDIKPDNIFLTESAGEPFVKVLDFGIAKVRKRVGEDMRTGEGLTQPLTILGTPEYMSPEQLTSPTEIDHRTDLWALGVVAYEMLVGEMPFIGKTPAALCVAICSGSFPPVTERRGDLPPELDEWFERALCVKRDARFGSAMQMAIAFVQACGARPSVVDLEATGKAVVPHPSPAEGASRAPKDANGGDGWKRAEWMVRQAAGQPEVGPMSGELLYRGLESGEIPPEAQVARVGSSDWQLASIVLVQMARPSKRPPPAAERTEPGVAPPHVVQAPVPKTIASMPVGVASMPVGVLPDSGALPQARASHSIAGEQTAPLQGLPPMMQAPVPKTTASMPVGVLSDSVPLPQARASHSIAGEQTAPLEGLAPGKVAGGMPTAKLDDLFGDRSTAGKPRPPGSEAGVDRGPTEPLAARSTTTVGGASAALDAIRSLPMTRARALALGLGAAAVLALGLGVVLLRQRHGSAAERNQAERSSWVAADTHSAASAGDKRPLRPVPEQMVAVPGGSYPIGCDERVRHPCYPDERPLHAVQLEPFAIMRQEVTMEQYDVCVAAGACPPAGKDKGCTWQRSGKEQRPINCISWKAAAQYCAYRGWRLPTEQEWEAAARGTGHLDYPWGGEAPSCQLTVLAEGGKSGCGSGGPLDVGSRAADKSWVGALDMAGNVREWTASEYAAYPGGTAEPGRKGKVNRGGSYLMGPRKLSAAHTREVDAPAASRPGLGVRCALGLR